MAKANTSFTISLTREEATDLLVLLYQESWPESADAEERLNDIFTAMEDAGVTLPE